MRRLRGDLGGLRGDLGGLRGGLGGLRVALLRWLSMREASQNGENLRADSAKPWSLSGTHFAAVGLQCSYKP